MRFLKLNQYESRQISLSIQSEKFKKWMGRYISAKDFYKLKKLLKYECVSIKDIHLSLQEKIFEKTKLEVDYINHKHLTKLSYTLLLFNFLKFNKNNQKIFEYLTKDYEKQISKFLESKNISIINKEIFSKFISKIKVKEGINKIDLFAPICPDYETKIDNYGNERYTFNGLNGGVGLVGRKFIENLPSLIEAFKIINIEIKPIILLGDFENSKINLERLNITNETFIQSLNSSKEVFKKTHGIQTEFFAEYFGGLDSWHKRIDNLKVDFNFKNIKSLYETFPEINHKEIFASRIALYNRWYRQAELMNNSFINQIYEYILMGNIISGYHKPCILVGSDHKAMAPYYATSFESAPILSLNNFY